jgi:hypothetical protein
VVDSVDAKIKLLFQIAKPSEYFSQKNRGVASKESILINQIPINIIVLSGYKD